MPKLPSTLRAVLDIVVWGGAALLFSQTIAGFVSIPSGSMQPTLQPGDYLLVNRAAYSLHVPFTSSKEVVRWASPSRGDIVIFHAPASVREDEPLYIKRVLALAGDTVSVTNDRVMLNGVELGYTRADACRSAELQEHLGERKHCVLTGASPLASMPSVTVPPGHVFVLGDHRNNSRDSRDWGLLPVERIRGEAVLRVVGGEGSGGFGRVR